jgi:DNA end-binding protein Ku
MADHAVWRGHLRLALVSCPVALHPAHHEAASLHFHFINPDTGNRVRMVTLDAQTGQELSRRDLARGYEFKKDHYLVLTDEDFDGARIDSSSVINVAKFVAADAIDPIYYDASYYLIPDGEAGVDVYVVLREAIARSGRVALSRVVIGRRERAVAILPMGRGLVVHTLHDPRELHDPQAAFAPVPEARPDGEMVKLAMQLVDRQSSRFDPADMTDRYEARLRDLIDAKLQGEGLDRAAEPDDDRGNVVDLMAALKRSLSGAPPKPDGKKAAAPAKSKAGSAKQAPGRSAASAAKPSRRRA